MRCSLAVMALAGCFSKPSPPCTQAEPLAFDVEADSCDPWGTAVNNAVFHQGGGVLTIAPPQNAYGYCASNSSTPFGEGGVFVEVEPAVGMASSTSFLVGANGADNPRLSEADDMLTLDQEGTGVVFARKPYVHDAMRWWRFVPDVMTRAVVAQTSPDGATWTEFGRAEASELPPVDQDLVAVAFQLMVSTGDTAGKGEFRSFDICPAD